MTGPWGDMRASYQPGPDPLGRLTSLPNGTTANAAEVNANFTAVVDGVNTALATRAADCVAVGGTWNAGASTCTAASNDNCFVGGAARRRLLNSPDNEWVYQRV